jgi:predicted ABC-type ATPase
MTELTIVQPTVYIIAGPNGAGKTTFATEFLPGFVNCREFLNADLIAAGLAPFAPETQNVRAGRLLLERISELSGRRVNFSFETTLSGRSYFRRLVEMKADGYRVVVFFLWLPNPEAALARVQHRVRNGGHNVPAADVERRYWAGIKNLVRVYRPLIDILEIYDGAKLPPAIIATEVQGRLTIESERLYHEVCRQAGIAT